jgi:hypothetical protein
LTLFPIDLGEGPEQLELSIQNLANFLIARAA